MSWNPLTWWQRSSKPEDETPQAVAQPPVAQPPEKKPVPDRIEPVTLKPTFSRDHDALPLEENSGGAQLKRINLADTPIRQASLLVRSVLEMRDAKNGYAAFWLRFRKGGWRPKTAKHAVAKLILLGGGVFLVGPLAGLFVPPTVIASNAREVRRLRRGAVGSRDRKAEETLHAERMKALVRRIDGAASPENDLPWELRSLWNISAWRLDLLADSYNRRIEVVSEVLGDATRSIEEREAAQCMGQMLSLEYVRLIGIRRDLMDLYGPCGPKAPRPLDDLGQYDPVIAKLDLFGPRAGCEMPIGWLLLPNGQFFCRQMLDQLQRDLEGLEGFHDAEADPLADKIAQIEATGPKPRASGLPAGQDDVDGEVAEAASIDFEEDAETDPDVQFAPRSTFDPED